MRIDYVIVYILLLIIAIVLANAVKKNGKELKALWFVILMFVLQAMAVFGSSSSSSYTPSVSAFLIAEYLGYFIFTIGADLVLLVQYVQSKKK